VDITFTDKKLEKLANDDRKLVKEFGRLRAEKIKARLTQLRFATEHGQYIWLEVTGVEVIEVVNYHKEK